MIVTDEFVGLARAQRRGLGVPLLPFTLIEHPLGEQREAGVHARADAAMDQIVRALCTPVGQLMQDEKSRVYPQPRSKAGNRAAPGQELP